MSFSEKFRKAPPKVSAVPFQKVFDDELQQIANSRLDRGIPADEGDSILRHSLIGLAFSGGGIRSATFNLGVMQAFAKVRILHCFDYLSTVSGGGYIGGWLIALTKRLMDAGSHKRFFDVEEALMPEQYTPEHRGERSFLHWLRLFSNYLTPRKGVFSGDTWAMVSTWMRNTCLNQIIVFLFCASLFLLCQSVLVALLRPGHDAALLASCIAVVCLAAIFMAVNVMKQESQRKLVPLRLELPATVVLPLVASLLLNGVLWHQRVQSSSPKEWIVWALAGGAYYLVPGIVLWVQARGSNQEGSKAPAPRSPVSIPSVLIGSFIAGVAGGCAVKAYGALLQHFHSFPPRHWNQAPATEWVIAVLGTGIIMEIMFHAGILRQGLTGRGADDLVRERWARVGGYITLTTIGWILFAGASSFGPLLVRWSIAKWIAGVSGALIWIFGTGAGLKAAQSAKIAGEKVTNFVSTVLKPEKKRSRILQMAQSPRTLDRIARIAPYIFAIGLLLLIASCVQIVAGYLSAPGATSTLWWHQLDSKTPDFSQYWVMQNAAQPGMLAIWGLLLFGTACLLSWRVDINEFSMHHFYRNRLVRCYLGASNPNRNPEPFAGFAPEDDSPLEQFANGYSGPYPILNAALNITSGKELGYETRRAKSFIFTPLYCGYEKNRPGTGESLFEAASPHGTFCNTYAPTSHGRNKASRLSRVEKRISLGSAMAISGAAACPNMGYHTSVATAILMTLFDVRLGWWMGNTKEDRTWQSPGPRLGLGYLFSELFGLADEDGSYVYLSDGGHFDNLGVYELIRRKCRLIVACDAGCDEEYGFHDLCSVIEKARIDFGAKIVVNFDKIRPAKESRTAPQNFVKGEIFYDPQNKGDEGTFIYVKASLPERVATRSEKSLPDDVWRYVEQEPRFPHQSTTDQWFDESQFESYRALGEYIGTAAAETIKEYMSKVLPARTRREPAKV